MGHHQAIIGVRAPHQFIQGSAAKVKAGLLHPGLDQPPGILFTQWRGADLHGLLF